MIVHSGSLRVLVIDRGGGGREGEVEDGDESSSGSDGGREMRHDGMKVPGWIPVLEFLTHCHMKAK